MKIKKITSILISLIIMVTICTMSIPTASAAINVNLAYASTDVVNQSPYPTPQYTTDWVATGYVEVANIAYSKNVVIHYTTDDVTWQDVNASYVKQIENNNEVWQFTTPITSLYYRESFKIKFAIKYEVNGQTYWDNNNGENYYLSSAQGIVLGNSNVAQYYSGATSTTAGNKYYGTVAVKNLGSDKNVKIRYTTNNWASYKEVNAVYSYVPNENPYNIEFYSFEIYESAPIEFAVSYSVNGQTFWDNNFLENYTISHN